MRETVRVDHLSVGIKFPNGEEQKPFNAENLFWLKTGLSLSLVNGLNDYTFW